MYKLLLCLRYLRTRWIALASIISVMLGVATMIVVNSVMAGFRHEMHQRLHGILSDIVVESHSLEGFTNVQWHLEEIRDVLGDDLESMSATVQVPAMLSFQFNGQWITRPVQLIGIDEQTYAEVGDFDQYLLHPENRKQVSFALHKDGYQPRLPMGGWTYRRERVKFERAYDMELQRRQTLQRAATRDPFQRDGDGVALRPRDALPPAELPPGVAELGEVPSAVPPDTETLSASAPAEEFDALKEQHAGVILGAALCTMRRRTPEGKVEDFHLCLPGDDVKLTFPTAGAPPQAANASFTVVDFYESKMSEYDSTMAFVPLGELQRLRGMIDPQSGLGAVTSIQIKLKPGADLNAARDKLQSRFSGAETQVPYRVQTWMEMQGPLLAAVQMETMILNILLFLIIAVAGFGILATFFMIVVEKTKDIGVLKSLGAPSGGIAKIFLGYGLSLGIVGSGVGMVMGLLFVIYINEIADLIGAITGQEVFNPEIYYFTEIPTIISPLTIGWIVAGAMLIAVLASVLPAIRAARLHPVEALRYE